MNPRVPLDRYLAANREHGERPVAIEMNITFMMCVVANLQLALRHPANTGASAEVVLQVVGHLSEILGKVDPVFAEVIAQGMDPRYDLKPADVVTAAHWSDRCNEWLNQDNMTIRIHVEETLVIHHWIEMPAVSGAPEVTAPAISETLPDGSRVPVHPKEVSA